MNRDLTINVNVNPNGQPTPTQTTVSETPEQQQLDNKTKGNGIKAAAMVAVAQRGATLATSNIGALTGNKTAQRNATRVLAIAVTTYAAFTNPGTAALALGAQFAGTAISNAIENQNTQLQIDYNRTLKQNLYNNNRR